MLIVVYDVTLDCWGNNGLKWNYNKILYSPSILRSCILSEEGKYANLGSMLILAVISVGQSCCVGHLCLMGLLPGPDDVS